MRLKAPGAAMVAIAVVLQTFAALAPALARPLTPAEQRYARWRANLPQCDSPDVVDLIQTRFLEREAGYWESGIEIRRLDAIKETGFRSNGVDYIPRRYCSAQAIMSDKKVRAVFYSIGEDQGMTGGDAVGGVLSSLTFGIYTSRLGASLGLNWGVDWCVVGLDRNYAYGANCKAARP